MSTSFQQKISWLLLLWYVPIALFMGLQHRHGSFTDSHSDVRLQEAVEFAGDYHFVDAADRDSSPYCPACHLQIRNALTVQSPPIPQYEGWQKLDAFSVDFIALEQPLPFSERAPPFQSA